MFVTHVFSPPGPLNTPFTATVALLPKIVLMPFRIRGILIVLAVEERLEIAPSSVIGLPLSTKAPASVAKTKLEKEVPAATSLVLVSLTEPPKKSASPASGALPPQFAALVQLASLLPPVHTLSAAAAAIAANMQTTPTIILLFIMNSLHPHPITGTKAMSPMAEEPLRPSSIARLFRQSVT